MKNLRKTVIILGILGFIIITSCITYVYLHSKNNIEMENMSKEQIFSLIDKGLKSSSNTEFFIYSRDFHESGTLERVYYEGEYKEINHFCDLSQYKESKFEFWTLRNTEDYVWGYFIDESEEKEKATYFIIDKSSGMLKSLNNDEIQILVY